MSLPEAVVVFGASGFIGRNIVDALRGKVAMLVGVSSNGRPVTGCTATVASAALNDIPRLPSRTAIIHVAAFRYVASHFAEQQAEVLSANIALTDLVYRFALSRGIGEIRAAGSAAVYPAAWPVLDDARPFDLNSWPHDGESAYAWSKRWGEIEADLWHLRAGLNTITFRLTNPYGPFDTLDETAAHVATAFAIRAIDEGPEFAIRGDPEAERDFVFAGDVAAAFVASLELHGAHDVVNCALGATTTIGDLAHAAMRAAGRERPVRVNPPPPGANPGIKVRRATAKRLRRLLPELPPFCDVATGMQKTIAWYRHALR